jgi:hypothetical protein
VDGLLITLNQVLLLARKKTPEYFPKQFEQRLEKQLGDQEQKLFHFASLCAQKKWLAVRLPTTR